MLRIGDLHPPDKSTKKRKRLGRGSGSGRGGTSGRGHKGALARSGSKKRPWFEGGQMPLSRRLPKKGFSNYHFKRNYQILNIRDLSSFKDVEEITPEILREHKIIRHRGPIKLLGEGEIRAALTVRLHKASKTAIEKIESAGGKFEEIV